MELHIYREITEDLQQIGTLHADCSFSYDSNYVASPNAQALSFSLPLRTEPYSKAEALPYFRGLLPEGKSLTSLALRIGRSENDYLGILLDCGLDCVGDVIINPNISVSKRCYKKITFEHLASIIEQNSSLTAANALAFSRLSLAGTQDKIGIFIDDKKSDLSNNYSWYQPLGSAPSNYILKIADENLPDLMIIEQIAMTCARKCGVDAAVTEIVNIGNGSIITKRFDRTERTNTIIDGFAAPKRRHQEDFTQAMGLMPESKYNELKGGTAYTIANFLRVHSASPAVDIKKFLRLCLFNYVIGNADNHLKNLSLLYSNDWKTVRLAPAYDIVPTTYYARFSREMGMALGSTRNIDEVDLADIKSLAIETNVSKRLLKKVAVEIHKRIMPAIETEAERLSNKGFSTAHYVADNIAEDVQPRLEVLNNFINKG